MSLSVKGDYRVPWVFKSGICVRSVASLKVLIVNRVTRAAATDEQTRLH